MMGRRYVILTRHPMGRVYFSKRTLGKVNYCKNPGYSVICILQRAFPAVEVAMVFAVFISLFREPASNKKRGGAGQIFI